MNFFEIELDPYKILGIPLKADWELVKATYKSLIKIYHPDVFKGEKAFAENRISDLNNAYEFLSDPETKEAYDASIDEGTYQQDEYQPNENEDEQKAAINALKEEWNFACEYYPHLQDEFSNLQKLNKQIALIFMATIVEKKLYHDALELKEYLENYFLTSKFGEDKELQEIAKYAIYRGEKRYALELNQLLIRLGEGSKNVILTKLSLQFPEIGFEVLSKIGRADLISPNNPRLKSFENNFKKGAPTKQSAPQHIKPDIPNEKSSGEDFVENFRIFLTLIVFGLILYGFHILIG